MNRKEFIRSCGWTCVGSIALLHLWDDSEASTPVFKYQHEENTIVIKRSEFTIVKKEKIIEKKYVIVKTDQFDFPICVYKLPDDQFSALLLQCPHKGCEVDPQGDYLVCPCHGSEFTNTGQVQNPPAEEDLKSFKTTVDNENIYVHLS